MEEGIRFAELLTPVEVEVDQLRPAQVAAATRHRAQEAGGTGPSIDQGPDENVTLPARTILVAAGTQPNTVLAREDPDNIVVDGRYFRALDEDGNPVVPDRVAKPAAVRVLDPSARRRRRGQLFRRSPSELFGKCRQGDGRRHVGLPSRVPHVGAARDRRARHPPNYASGSTTSCARGCTRSSG